MNPWALLGGIGVGALGTFLLGITGVLQLIRDTLMAVRDRRHEDKTQVEAASATVVREALELVDRLSTQVKDLRSENDSRVEELQREVDALRKELRQVRARVTELEGELDAAHGENRDLKARLYDQHMGKQRGGSVTRLHPRRQTPTTPDDGA